MPIILASLVFAFALAALPSTEPLSPDEQEQAEYVAHLKDEREKRRWKIRQKETDNFRRRLDKIPNDSDERRRMRGENINLKNDDRRSRRKYVSGLGLNLPFEQFNGLSRGRLISDIYPATDYKKTHLRRSSSVPSLSSTSSASSSSRDSSPGSSPKRFSAILV
ncbi:hypothetical protein I203_102575 [Kwoniella mangroviensis CBS 8507]|uniref:uncharacterized protein n=1 Tax=Kwoniella mangroviensis CBS 8507 TaxID=1296122 RepID=UPI00080CFD9C|nr:uncharacterized protein I203_03560 [Kwoniella mangroviensis CBS 8507]OCF66879.1 hypothetical protein I203_03560 [Kwoniella mangroviensis CBS 8507]